MNRVTLLVVLVGALISLHWNPVFAQDALGTPTITLVSVGISSLTVIWSTPDNDGGSSIIAYDLRYILSSAGNKADDQWTLKEDIWTSGITLYQLTDLAEDTGYDIQVRAVNGDGDGPWSSTFARTTSDLSETCRGFDDTYDDPLFGCQWHLKNTGQYGGAGKDINIETAWAITKGSGINVAIVDDGLHSDHLDLSANVDTSKNHDYHGNGLFNPAASHGTSVAGIIAAADDEQGIRGVAPDATIYAYNINADPDHLIRPDFPLTRDLTDTAVSNNSYGFPGDGRARNRSDVWENAIERGVSTGFDGKGVSYVFSGGNGAEQTDDTNLNGRTNHYGVIAVCAVDYNDRRAYYSERGASLWLCAPSSGSSGAPWIWTTENGGYTSQFGGTSAATAIVSGVVALVRAANMELTWRDVKLILAASARKNDSGNTGWEQGALKYGSTSHRYSFNHEYGFGVVDAGVAVGLAANWSSPPELREIKTTSDEVDLSIPEAPISGSPTTVSTSLTVDRYVQFAEFIEVTVDMQHTNFRNLEIELVSPSGKVSRLANTGKAHIRHQGVFLETKDAINGEFDFGSAKHLGEDPAGTWTLRITDRDRRFDDTGTLRSWSLTVYGHGHSPGYSEIDSAVGGDRTLTITWSARDDNGGSAVTSYDLRYVRDDAGDKSSSAWTIVTAIATTDADTYELTGLKGGVEYNLQVRAVNGNGVGPWSESFSSSTTDVVPTVPAITTMVPRSQELVVSWTRPEEGTASLTSYELRHIRSDASETDKMDDDMWTTVAPAWSIGDGVLAASISSLQNDVAYDVQVRGRNAQGAGPWSMKMSGTPHGVNQKPKFPSTEIGGRSVNENVSAGTNVGSPVRANDPNRDSLIYSLTGTDAHAFAIVEMTGQIQTNAPLDRETKESYSVTVNVSDGMDDNGDDDPAIDDSIDVVITVADVNEPPTVEGDTEFFVPENDETFDAIYYAQDPERSSTTFTWSVSGTDGSDFNINRDTGVLTFRNTPDYEGPADSNRDNEYLVQVRASDGQYTGRLDVTVTVTNVNEPPEFNSSSLGRTSFSYAENGISALYTYRATDPEGATITWSVSGTDDDDFDISETGVLTFAEIPDFEAPYDANQDNEYLVTVEARDDAFNYARLDVTVDVTNSTGAEEPTITTTSNPSPYRENGTGTVYTFRARDPQGRAVTWSVTGTDSDAFDISSSGALTFATPPDFENPADSNRDNEYEITVVVADDQNRTDSVDVTITVTNHNEGVEPTISTRGPPSTYRENGTSTVYTFRASDPQRQDITWTLEGADSDDLNISSTGALVFINRPDFEAPVDSDRQNDYQLTVIATDEDGHADRLSFTITVTDVNEGPEVTSGGSSFTVRENRNWSGATFTASDPEGGSVTRWSLGGRDGGDFTITHDSITNDGQITFRNTPDHERPDDSDRDNTYEVEIRPYDGRYYGSHHITVTVEDAIEITGPSTLGRAENFTGALATYAATGVGDLTVDPAWRLMGTDGGDFTISEQGEVSFRSTPDHERPADSNRDNIYNFAVQATDGRYYDSYDVTVTVTPVNEPPTITTTSTSATTLRQPENRTTRLYTYRATDPEGVATIIWLVGGVDERFFTITERGEFSFREDSPPDYEQPGDSGRDNVYDVLVQARDAGGIIASLPVTVTVTDVNEGPEVTSGRDSFTINENQDLPNASYAAFDPEGGAVTRWAVGGTDGGDFTITHDTVTNEGVLTFRNLPDYEGPADSNRDNVYQFQVRPYDGRYYGSFDVTVTVTPVNEPPTITTTSRSATTMTHPENGISALYTYRATDPEGATITWSVSGTDDDDFDISETGVLTFAEIPDFEAPYDANQDNEYLVTVEARDDAFNYARLDVTVDVTNSTGAEEPTITTTSNPSPYRENGTGTVYTFRARDPQGRAVTWSVTGTDSDAFDISSSGALTFATPPDFENPADSNRDNEYEITVVVADDQNRTDSVDVTITVTNHNEGVEPTISTRGPPSTYRENGTSTVYTFRASDPQRQDITWTLEGADSDDLNISSTGALVFINRPDFEAPVDSDRQNDYQLTVIATDEDGHADRLSFTITVTDVNEGPEVTSGGSSFTVRENRNWSGATFTASDPEGGSVTRWSLGGRDGGDFTITHDSITNDGQITFRNTPDHERPDDSDRDNTYEVEIRPYDGRYYGSHHITVTVEDAIEITGPSTLGRAENFTGALATYAATGVGDLTVDPAWRLMGTDGGDFTISEQGEVSFRSTPDHERPADSNRDNIYNFAVQATDGRYYDSYDVTVTVTPVNEPPTITTTSTSATTLRQPENRTTRLYTYRATDPEGVATIIWLVGGVDERFFTITERGEFSFREDSPPDYEQPGDSGRDNVYDVLVQARDAGGIIASLPVTVTVTDVNEGPEVTSGRDSFTINENQDLPNASYAAFDPEGGAVTRWAVGGTDGGDFTITHDTVTNEGVLTFRNLPDYEGPADSNRDNVYQFQVRPYDGRYYGSFDVTVTVTPVNEPPTITTTSRSATTMTHPENGISALYTYRATDPEGEAITWTVAGVDARFFAINDRGEFSFSESNPPDFEARAALGQEHVYNVTVQAGDGAHTASLPVAVTVTDVNEGPEVTGTASFTIAENGRLSGAAYSARDPEGEYVTRWSVGGRDGGDFFITQGGTLYFRNLPDFERPADSNRDNVYEVIIQPYDGRNTGSFAVTITVTDVNEPPEFRSDSRTSFTQPENRATRLYTYSATDPEGGTVTWTVGGTDGGHFAIDERGQFSFDPDNPPDFDSPGDSGRNSTYNVNIEATDPESNTARLPVTVVVTEVNEGPVITRQGSLSGSPPGSVPENHPVTQALATYTAADPERPTVRITQWSTSGRDGGDFVMNALGELRFRNSPDYERPADADRDNVYEVTIRASDGRNTGTLEEVQVVTVTDVNEPPTITTTGRTDFTQQENRVSTLYTFRATDPEGSTVAWTPAGTDGRFFTIDERGRFSFTNPPDFESPADAGRDNVYDVTVEARDPGFNAASLEVAVTVINHNEGVQPTISTRRPPTTYRENGTSTVYTFRASDPQRGVITWSLTGPDAGDFSISESGALTFNSTPDFENPADADRDNTYELTVVATDAEGYTDRVSFTIAVTNHNEGVEPTISTRRPPSTYRENGTSTVYTFSASDPQRDPITWSLTGTDAGDFTITPDSSGRGVLTFNEPPDFENPADSDRDNEYELAVVATDDNGNADRVAFTITVTDVNEGPQITLQGTAVTTVPENYADTAVLARFAAADPENPGSGIYRWSSTGRDGGDFLISALGELRFRVSPDYERPADADRDNVYEVTVRAYDGRVYGTLEEPLMVTVTEVNEAPVITTKSRTEFTVRENSTAIVYTYQATDEDEDDIVRWSVEGTDGEDFAIYNGMLTFRRLPDLEIPADADRDNVYEITVVAADNGGLRDTVDATIAITDQSEGPVVAGTTSFTVTENYDITQALGSYTATDARDMRTVYPQWSLSGRDGGDFVIDRYSGALNFRNTPDYDSPADSDRDNLYEVTVRAHDSRAYGYLNVTVTVTNTNEGEPVVTGRTSHSVRENTTSVIHTYRATDTDLGDTIAWSTGGEDGRHFVITRDSSDRGLLAFASPPDFEDPADSDQDNVYQLEVVATDGAGLRGTLAVTVTVTALNEGPVVSGTAAFTINENQDLDDNQGGFGTTYVAADPEAIGGVTTTITWSVSGRDGGDFAIDRETGTLTFRTPPNHERPADYNGDNTYELTVRAYDGRNYGTFDVTVTVLAVNEGPEITGRDAFTYRENGTSALYTYRATDPEGDDFAWGLGGLDAGDFSITTDSSGRGVLTFASPPNFDSPAGSGTDRNEYLVTVRARDDQGNTGELPVTVSVTDQNEGAVVSGLQVIAVQENRDPALVLARYSASDPEGLPITRWSLSGSDGGDFTISENGELRFRNTPDYDQPADSNRDNEYRVTVRAYDGRTYGNLDAAIRVSNVNEHDPVIRSGSPTSFSHREESASALYTYRATDGDKDDVITWTTAGTDGRLFEFNDRNGLEFSTPPDYEDPGDTDRNHQYELTVVATDSGGRSDRLDITVSVTAVDEGPEITGTTNYTVLEGQELIGATFTARDPEDPTIEVSNWRTSGTDGGDFTISQGGELSFRNTADYDQPADSNRDNVYLVTVQVSDGRYYGSLEVTVTVTDQNESAPVVTGQDTLSFRENTTSTLYTYRVTDMDRGAEITWSVRGADGDDFIISDEGALSFISNPNHEQPTDSNADNVYEITVVSSDGTNEGTLDVTVTITEVNEGPEISGAQTLTFGENTATDRVLATYSATDPEDTAADITRWSASGRDGGDFTINSDGELTFRYPPNYERPADANRDNLYEVTVRASDGRVYGSYDVVVTVQAVDEAPELRSGSRVEFSYRENGTSSLYTYRATDPEGSDVAWSVSGSDAEDFVVSESGVLSFGQPPDYDDPGDLGRDNQYQITVVAADQTGHAANLPVTVTVTDVNEGPIISGTGEFTVQENHDAVLGTYTARDPEIPDLEITHWSVTGRDGGDFTINEDGELTFRNPPDSERPADSNRDSIYEVTVRASDGRYYGAFDVTVTVEEVDEAPEFRSDNEDTFTYRENQTSTLHTYRATDPEGSEITWVLSGDDMDLFEISEDGELTFIDSPDYEDPADLDNDNVYEVTVEAIDENDHTAGLEVTVTVVNLTD